MTCGQLDQTVHGLLVAVIHQNPQSGVDLYLVTCVNQFNSNSFKSLKPAYHDLLNFLIRNTCIASLLHIALFGLDLH